MVDILVIIKGVILIVLCLIGIKWFIRNEFIAFSACATILTGCILIIFECVYRFSDGEIRFRHLLNACSQWVVLLSLTVMLGFSIRNDAAKFKYPIRSLIFIPLHVLYALSIILALAAREDTTACKDGAAIPVIYYF